MLDILLFSFATLLSSFISGLTGLGGGILLLAFMTPLFPPNVLIPLHGIIQLISNSTRVVLRLKKLILVSLLCLLLGQE